MQPHERGPDGAIHIETDEARGGATPHVTRWVLGISLALAVIAMSAVWIIPSLTQGDRLADGGAGETMQEQQER